MRDLDYASAVDFLAQLFGNTEHAVEIRILHNKGGAGPPLFTRETQLVKDHCQRWDRQGVGVFFGCCTRLTGHGTGGRADLAELPALWVDIDVYKLGIEKDAAVAALHSMQLMPPSLIVDSGGGIHAYWLLREPVDARPVIVESGEPDDVKERVDAVLKQLAGVFCGDPLVCQIAAVMRLPGTHNSKTGEMRPVAVLEANEQARYELSDLEDILFLHRPLLTAPAAVAGDAAPIDPFTAFAKRYSFSEPVDVYQRLADMRYLGAGDSGIHTTQLSVSASLVSSGVEDDQIVELLLTETRRVAGLNGEHWNWQREERNLRRLCADWRKKLEKEAAVEAVAASPTKDSAKDIDGKVVQLRAHRQAREEKATAELAIEAALANLPELAGYPLNDIGNAARLIAHHGADLRFVSGIGWYTWDGQRFAFDPATCAARGLVHDTILSIMHQALEHKGTTAAQIKARKAVAKFFVAVGNSGRISGMLSQAEVGLVTPNDSLDRDPWLLNCSNGTVELRTGALRAHAQSDLLTKLVPVDYNPDAPCPIWERFLSEIFGGDLEMVDYLQRALGYSISGDTREQVVFILHGTGSNGKSVLLEIVSTLLADYAQLCPSDTFAASDRAGNGPRSDIARLIGSRFVSVIETEQDRKMAEALVKQATGGDRLVARFLHREFFEFVPQFKLWMATNHKPRVRGTDNAIWRRLRLLPFLVVFKDEDEALPGQPVKDRDLKNKLLAELPGILAWLVRGCLRWQKEGLRQAPKAVLEATTDYRESQDITAGFIAECCWVEPMLQCAVGELYKAYKNWCVENGETVITSTAFGLALEEKGFARFQGNYGRRFRRGIDLKGEFRSDANSDLPNER